MKKANWQGWHSSCKTIDLRDKNSSFPWPHILVKSLLPSMFSFFTCKTKLILFTFQIFSSEHPGIESFCKILQVNTQHGTQHILPRVDPDLTDVHSKLKSTGKDAPDSCYLDPLGKQRPNIPRSNFQRLRRASLKLLELRKHHPKKNKSGCYKHKT